MICKEFYDYIPRELPEDIIDVLGTDDLTVNPEALALYLIGFMRGKQQALRMVKEELANE